MTAVDVSAQPLADLQGDAIWKVLTDSMPQMVWTTLPDGFHDYYNARWYEFTGVPVGSTDGEAWNGMFHPDDQEMAWGKWRHSLATGDPYEVEYRLRHRSGQYRWTLGRALPVHDGSGAIVRWIGTCTDIDAAKRDAEQNEVLSRELSHRIKNIFAVIAGLVGLSARHHPEVKPLALDLQQRIAALGRAHDLARPHSDESRPSVGEASLHSILTTLLSAYPALDEGRIRIAGADMPIDDKGATPIALVFHELATNAAKYGALGVPEGRVDINVSAMADTIRVDWIERGGPAIAEVPTRRGFGTKLVELSIVQQLGGGFEQKWVREGLEAVVTLPARSLARG